MPCASRPVSSPFLPRLRQEAGLVEAVTARLAQVPEAFAALRSGLDQTLASPLLIGRALDQAKAGRRFVTETLPGEVGEEALRVKLGRGPEARAELQQAQELGIPVEGVVQEVIKGGVSVDVAGVRGFCPASQLEEALRRLASGDYVVEARMTLDARVNDVTGGEQKRVRALKDVWPAKGGFDRGGAVPRRHRAAAAGATDAARGRRSRPRRHARAVPGRPRRRAPRRRCRRACP